jgi:hypothetical protein
MAKMRQSSLPKWLRHRTLLATEAVLIVGVVQELMQRWVMKQDLANAAKVLFVMLSTIGIIGLVLVIVRTLVLRSLEKTHQVAKAMFLPMAVSVMHVLILVSIFYLYAYVWELWVWPMR